MSALALPEILDLLKTPELAELGPGPRADVQSEAALTQKLQSILGKSKLSPTKQDLVRALILIWHDQHEPAHSIAQVIETWDGSFVHGILHRREPDYGNAKYWFRRVGKHAVFPKLAEQAKALLKGDNKGGSLVREIISSGEWNALTFIDACERAVSARNSDTEILLLRQLQRIETETLLQYFVA